MTNNWVDILRSFVGMELEELTEELLHEQEEEEEEREEDEKLCELLNQPYVTINFLLTHVLSPCVAMVLL